MSTFFIDRPIIAGPGQLRPADLVTPVYQAALRVAHEQLDKLPQLREQGRITELAYTIADAELMAVIHMLHEQLTAHGVQVLEPVR
jgi:hypothetical protein